MSERPRHRLTRIYTRSGDAGETGLAGGQRVSKAGARIEAYGTVDELSALLGLARAANLERPDGADGRGEIDEWLRRIQNDLFHVGADLATRAEDRPAGMTLVGDGEVRWLEEGMDRMNELLGPLDEFILPGGGPVGATLHVARTVCRRAERRVVALCAEEPGDGRALRYLNRLSDFLFVLARQAARLTGHPEQLWER